MATAIKKCRVCGKQYEACHTVKTAGSFRWQEVACSPECGSIYLSKIEESRGVGKSTPHEAYKQTKVDVNYIAPEVDEYDDDLYDEYDDEDEYEDLDDEYDNE